MRMRRARWLATALVAAAVLLAGAPIASAAGPPALPGDFSAADQYAETVPTSGGPSDPTIGRGASAPLPPAISGHTGRLEGKLKQVATSSKLGAPQRKLPHARVDSPSVPSAAVSALDQGDGSGLIWLLVALLLLTAGVAGTAGHRHYRKRRTVGDS